MHHALFYCAFSPKYAITANANTRAWVYDARGRAAAETLTIDGLTFKTQFTYNSADKIASITYPGGGAGENGETVTYTYLPQLLPYRLNNGGNYYVHSAAYDNYGRLRLMQQNTAVYRRWEYYASGDDTTGGLLYSIKAGSSSDDDAFRRYTDLCVDSEGRHDNLTGD